MSKTIIISESMAEELQESLSMTKFKFLANMKKFLANLLTDPVNSEPEYIFKHNGLNKTDLINHLLDNNIILRKNTIENQNFSPGCIPRIFNKAGASISDDEIREGCFNSSE